MMSAQNKSGRGAIPSRSNQSKLPAHHTSISHAKARVLRAIWRSGYSIELARQDHADTGHLWRQAGCCIVLSFIRMIGGRI